MSDSTRGIHDLINFNHSMMLNNSSLTKEEYLNRLTDQSMSDLLSIDHDQFTLIDDAKKSLMKVGKKEQKSLWQLSHAMEQPLQRLMHESHSTERVNDLLQEMQTKISKLKPPKNNSGGLKAMFLLLFSWKQSAWQLWLENYHELKTDIKKSAKVLADEKAQLQRDSQMLSDEKVKLNKQLVKLEHVFDLLVMFNEKIKKRTYTHDSSSKEIISVFDAEFKPVVHERINDLQQQLLIGRQTLMTIDLIKSQNMSQVNGIEQALQTTASALDVTAGLVLAQHGRQALNKLESKLAQRSNTTSNYEYELKQVQLRIDEALQQIDSTRKTLNISQSN